MGYTHGIKWNDDKVKETILKVKKSLNLNRMPTKKEFELVMGNSSLTSKISRTKGYYGWAKELNLDIKESETTFGKKYEYIVKEYLENKGYQIEKMPQNYSFDLLVNNFVKIDVKVAKPYVASDNTTWHTFNLYKKYAYCDIYVTLCLDNDENIEKMLIIPSIKCQIKQLSVGKESKYDKYNYELKYIDDYIKFYNNL